MRLFNHTVVPPARFTFATVSDCVAALAAELVSNKVPPLSVTVPPEATSGLPLVAVVATVPPPCPLNNVPTALTPP